jgi:hypothetical protein
VVKSYSDGINKGAEKMNYLKQSENNKQSSVFKASDERDKRAKRAAKTEREMRVSFFLQSFASKQTTIQR